MDAQKVMLNSNWNIGKLFCLLPWTLMMHVYLIINLSVFSLSAYCLSDTHNLLTNSHIYYILCHIPHHELSHTHVINCTKLPCLMVWLIPWPQINRLTNLTILALTPCCVNHGWHTPGMFRTLTKPPKIDFMIDLVDRRTPPMNNEIRAMYRAMQKLKRYSTLDDTLIEKKPTTHVHSWEIKCQRSLHVYNIFRICGIGR